MRPGVFLWLRESAVENLPITGDFLQSGAICSIDRDPVRPDSSQLDLRHRPIHVSGCDTLRSGEDRIILGLSGTSSGGRARFE